MTRTEINDIIVNEIKKVLENDTVELNAETVIQDIPEWDSLNNVDLEMTLETECGIDFEVGEFEELKTLADMIDTVKKKVN
ncbi:MAG: hypothetical protein COB07_05805 [Sulfurovum sp.]|nr:MAG: hypothetical protein COB07_05805 [Sulfurovum sp.]